MQITWVHMAPTPLGGPLKLQVVPQYLRSDPREKAWKVPGTFLHHLHPGSKRAKAIGTPADWSDLVSTVPHCYDDQYY